MIKRLLKKAVSEFGRIIQVLNREALDPRMLAIGKLLSNQQWTINSNNLNDFEFKIFSEWGDDGIIQYLLKHIPIKNKTFIEFGVENYMESNTRFLMMNDNWSGFIMDGSLDNMKSIQKRSWFFRYDLRCRTAWIEKDNINDLLKESRFEDLGLLHIDLDGNDYYILQEIDFRKLNPAILILEYNSVFGSDRAISIPYRKDFNRTKAHFSNLFFGASLSALNFAAEQKGYSLIGCNLAGNNAYFVRNDLLNERIRKKDLKQAYIESKFRESRDQNYNFSFVSGNERIEHIRGLDVFNVVSGKLEKL